MIKNAEVKAIFNKVLESLKELKENAWDEIFDMKHAKALWEDLPKAIKTLDEEPEVNPEDTLDKMISDIDAISAGILKSNNIETLRNYAIALKKELDKTKSSKELNDLFDMNKDSYEEENHEKLREIYKGYCKTKKFSIDETEWLMKNRKGNPGLRIGKSIFASQEDNKSRLIELGGIKVHK